jgi:hypothetical protein
MEALGILLMQMMNYILSSSSNNIIGSIFASYTGIYGLEVAVTYIYISLDVIGNTGLIEPLCWGYNLICNANLQLYKYTVTTFDDAVNITGDLATNLGSKEEDVVNNSMFPFCANDLCGSCPLNSEANLSKIPSGMMCRVPSLREANESGVGKSPYSLSLYM